MRILILLIVMLLESLQLYSQEKFHYNDSYNNSLKVIFLPNIIYSYGFISAGYERKLNSDFSLSLSTSRTRYSGLDGFLETRMYDIIPELRYYIPKKNNKWPVIWFGGMLFHRQIHRSDLEYAYINGAGFSSGTKLFLTKKQNWFIEFGGIISANYEIRTIIYECPCKQRTFPVYIPKALIYFGRRF